MVYEREASWTDYLFADGTHPLLQQPVTQTIRVVQVLASQGEDLLSISNLVETDTATV